MRAIDADELKEVLHTMQILQTMGCQYNVIDVIDSMKTLELRPKGEWIDDTSTSWECSCCGYGVNRWNNTPFCPNCGAKMNDVGKSKEESNNMRRDEPSDDKTFLDCWINDPCLALTNPPKLIWKCRYCGNEITTDINSLPNKVCKCLKEDKTI